MAKIPDHVEVTTSPHLFYKKYPHKVSIRITESAYRWDNPSKSLWGSAKTSLANVRGAVAKLGWEKKDYRTMENFYSYTVFVETEDQVDEIIKIMNTTRTKFEKIKSGYLKIGLATMTDEQANASLNDAKIEYRKSHFFKTWEWKIETSIKTSELGDIRSVEELLFDATELENFDSIYGTVSQRPYRCGMNNQKARLTYLNRWGSTDVTIFLNDEDDVAMIRLMIPAKTKLTRSVLVS